MNFPWQTPIITEAITIAGFIASAIAGLIVLVIQSVTLAAASHCTHRSGRNSNRNDIITVTFATSAVRATTVSAHARREFFLPG